MESTEEMIKKRAYELYLKKKGAPDNPNDDWQQAEKEILAELEAKKKTAVPVVPAKSAPVAATAPVVPVKAKAVETKPAAPIAKSPEKSR